MPLLRHSPCYQRNHTSPATIQTITTPPQPAVALGVLIKQNKKNDPHTPPSPVSNIHAYTHTYTLGMHAPRRKPSPQSFLVTPLRSSIPPYHITYVPRHWDGVPKKKRTKKSNQRRHTRTYFYFTYRGASAATTPHSSQCSGVKSKSNQQAPPRRQRDRDDVLDWSQQDQGEVLRCTGHEVRALISNPKKKLRGAGVVCMHASLSIYLYVSLCVHVCVCNEDHALWLGWGWAGKALV